MSFYFLFFLIPFDRVCLMIFFFLFSNPIHQDHLPPSFFSEQQSEVVVDFCVSLLAQFIILFLHERDGRDDDYDDDDAFNHTVLLLHCAEANSLCFEAYQRTCLVKCYDFYFFPPKGLPHCMFCPTVWTRISLPWDIQLCLDKFLTSLLDTGTLIHSVSMFKPQLNSKPYCLYFILIRFLGKIPKL